MDKPSFSDLEYILRILLHLPAGWFGDIEIKIEDGQIKFWTKKEKGLVR